MLHVRATSCEGLFSCVTCPLSSNRGKNWQFWCFSCFLVILFRKLSNVANEFVDVKAEEIASSHPGPLCHYSCGGGIFQEVFHVFYDVDSDRVVILLYEYEEGCVVEFLCFTYPTLSEVVVQVPAPWRYNFYFALEVPRSIRGSLDVKRSRFFFNFVHRNLRKLLLVYAAQGPKPCSLNIR